LTILVKIVTAEPQPGTIKMVHGVAYIYAKNRRWMPVASEPEYVWMRKDMYSPGLLYSIKESSEAEKKEIDQLKERIERLEAELKKRGG
jgi:hypothetical protein